MSSTDAERDEQLRRFYVERLLPAAERLRERNVRFFSMGPERGHPPSSYFEPRRDSKTASYVFELETLTFSPWLRARWEEYPELLAIVEPLAELARAMEHREEQTGEVSPLIYAMF
ncbi:MAG: hypothetical protein M3373_01565 [Gemmatimonadota bacterium]|nr:hypothetical protein [Gemmatimonadota bacterium]